MTEFDVMEVLNRIEAKVDGQAEKIADIRVNVSELFQRTKTLEKGAEDMIQEKIVINNKLRDNERRRGDNRTKLAVAFIGALSGLT